MPRRRFPPPWTFVFIGLENINPESLLGTKKCQNKIWEYREMLLQWRRHRVITYAESSASRPIRRNRRSARR